MKKIDIRKIYIGEILKQSGVTVTLSGETALDGYSFSWDYEDEKQLGLFTKTLVGYKHILTNTIYQKPSKMTGNKHVINPNNIEEFVKKERALASHLITKNQSYDIDLSVIKSLEERINSDAQYTNENEEVLAD